MTRRAARSPGRWCRPSTAAFASCRGGCACSYRWTCRRSAGRCSRWVGRRARAGPAPPPRSARTGPGRSRTGASGLVLGWARVDRYLVRRQASSRRRRALVHNGGRPVGLRGRHERGADIRAPGPRGRPWTVTDVRILERGPQRAALWVRLSGWTFTPRADLPSRAPARRRRGCPASAVERAVGAPEDGPALGRHGAVRGARRHDPPRPAGGSAGPAVGPGVPRAGGGARFRLGCALRLRLRARRAQGVGGAALEGFTLYNDQRRQPAVFPSGI